MSLYVHYFAQHYQQSSDSFLKAYAMNRVSRMAASLQSKASQASKQQYANILNALFTNRTSSSDVSSITQGQVWQEITQYLGDRIDQTTGQATKVDSNFTGSIKKPNNVKEVTQKQVMGQAAIAELKSSIQTVLQDLRKSNISHTEMQNYMNQLQLLDNKINKGLTSASKLRDPKAKRAAESAIRLHPELKGSKWVSLNTLVGTKTKRDLVQEYNNILHLLYQVDIIDTLTQGDLFEYLGYYASEIMNGQAVSSIQDAIQTTLSTNQAGVYGRVTSELQWLLDGIDAEVLAKSWLKDASKKEFISNNVRVTTHKHSQQKIDVVIELTDDQQQKITVPASFKSTNLTHGLKLVSGTNLWYLLQDESMQFKKGYLNIMSDHKESLAALKRAQNNLNKRKTSGRDWKTAGQIITKNATVAKEEAAIKDLKSQRDDAKEAALLISIAKAASGATFGRIGAEIMVVNDISTKQIYVIEMADLIKEICINRSLATSSFITAGDLISFNTIYTNKWGPTKHARVASILDQIHNQKIQLSLNPKIISTVAKTTGV